MQREQYNIYLTSKLNSLLTKLYSRKPQYIDSLQTLFVILQRVNPSTPSFLSSILRFACPWDSHAPLISALRRLVPHLLDGWSDELVGIFRDGATYRCSPALLRPAFWALQKNLAQLRLPPPNELSLVEFVVL